MTPFLRQVASLFYGKYGAEVSRLTFVFPSRRAGLFFQKYLSMEAGKPLFSPTVLTINDLFLRLSGKQTADRISMLFRLYEIYSRLSRSEESFDEFLFWGEMLLNDFDDVDKYMVDARQLFRNVTDLRELDHGYDFLSEAQVAAIRSFWSTFFPSSDTPNQQTFLALWQILLDLYETFRTSLEEEGKAYEGMIFREVVERLERGEEMTLPYEQIVFVGLNALSVSEERLLTQLLKRGVADFYWDASSDKVMDPDNKASFFLLRNLKRYPSSMPLPEEAMDTGTAQIEVIGIPSGIGQAKHLHTLLSQWCEECEMSPESALRTAIVLPDERLLLPVLNSIPKLIQHINVTMGYPLAGTPVATLMDYILVLQRDLRYVEGIPMFYFRDVLPILTHRYLMTIAPEATALLVRDITENNRIYVSQADLARTSLLKVIFTPVEDATAFPDYLIQVLAALNKWLSAQEGGDDMDEEEARLSKRATDIEQEFIFHYFATVNRMREVMREVGIEMRMETFFRLMRRMANMITIPFQGEPLSGLQIMGVLETRALDFDRLIILSMNEGIFPQRKVPNSFIPYNLRKGFGLPTYEHQDSIWAYHFYRLIGRASRVSLLYDTRSTGLQTGEMSRFIHQLRYHYEVPFREKLMTYNISSAKMPSLSMRKGEEVRRLLDNYREGGEKALSASAINTYLDCPLKFYFSVLEGIREEDEVSESVESDTFGSILHKVMEILYKPLCGRMVTTDALKGIREDTKALSEAIGQSFASEFFNSERVRPLIGRNYLTAEMIRKYALRILEQDTRLAPFTYLESERRVKSVIELSDHSRIQLKGFIDRMDKVNGLTRIIDYKSGIGDTKFSDIPSLFDKGKKDRAKAVMQVFMYCWMYTHLEGNEHLAIQPGIYYVRGLFKDSFDPYIKHHQGKDENEMVETFEDYAEDFEEGLRGCLDEIFDPSTPFTQTPIEDVCRYCYFKGICGKRPS